MHRASLEVGILKPMEPPVLDRQSTEMIEDIEEKGSRPIDRRVCKILIEEMRRMIVDVADMLCRDIHIKEFPVCYDPQKKLVIKNFASAEEICKKDITVVVDPQDNGLSFAAGDGATTNPLRRVIAAFSEKAGFEERFDVLGSLKLPLAIPDDEDSIDMLPKAFGLYIPAYADDAANLYQKNRDVVATAIAYPYGLTVRQKRKKYFEFN